MRYIGLAFLLAALIGLAIDGIAQAAPPDSPAKGSLSPDICHEDEPCWDWANMGNKRRGVVTLYGDSKVVGPCQFNRLWAKGAIRHEITVGGQTYQMMPRLKGDRYARTLTDCPWRLREGK